MKARMLKKLAVLAAATLGIGGAATVQAGSVYLTGHDTLLHAGQNGYDTVILNWLRGAGTSSEIAAASYDIAVVGSGAGSASFTGQVPDAITGVEPAGTIASTGRAIPLTGAISGYASATYYHATSADWTSVLSKDLLIILSHTSCGGCDISDADVLAINAQSAAIATAFNAGMDIWGNSGANSTTYYNFLPAGATTTGPPISGSFGFDATNAGDAIGIVSNMINGFPTHNRFAAFDPDFVVFETRPATGVTCNTPPFATGCEIISIGIRDATITDGGIGTDGGTSVPEPGVLALLGLGVLGMALTRRRRQS